MVGGCKFFFALFSLFRTSISIGLLERPLVIGFLWGALTGDYSASLGIAIFFELFWLDNIPAGTYIPPQLIAPTLAACVLVTKFEFTQARQIALVLLACMPLAKIGVLIESSLRKLHNKGYQRLINWARKGSADDPIPSELVYSSIFRTFIASFFFFWSSVLILYYVLRAIFHKWGLTIAAIDLQWSYLWIAASLGGLLALRLRKAYATLAFGIVLSGFFVLAVPV
jgi:PTS system mannose-specific IIC component